MAATGRWLFTEGAGSSAAPVRGPVSLDVSTMAWSSDAAGEGVLADNTPPFPESAWAGVAGTPLDWGATTTLLALGQHVTVPVAGAGDWWLMLTNGVLGSHSGALALGAQFLPGTSTVRIWCSVSTGDGFYDFDATGLLVGAGPVYMAALYDSNQAVANDRIRFWLDGAFIPRSAGAGAVPLGAMLQDFGATNNLLYTEPNVVPNMFLGAADFWVGSTPTEPEIVKIANTYAVDHDIDPEAANAPVIWFGTNA